MQRTSRPVYVLALQRALESIGSEEEVARRLGITVSLLRSYLLGAIDLPVRLFLRVVDLLYPVGETTAHLAPLSTDERSRPPVDSHAAASKDARLGATPAVNSHRRAEKPSDARKARFSHPFFATDFSSKDRSELLAVALDAAMWIADADLGNVQLVDSSGDLRIEVQHGFSEPFLKFFERVSGPESACGAALKDHRQVFVGDVKSHPLFAGTESGKVVLDAGVRAVASSPIVNDSGVVVGMLSTHYREPRLPQAVNLAAQQLISKLTAEWLRVHTI
jgi:hypothetical protein